MNRQQLIDQVKAKQSFLCVGLDTDPSRLPPSLKKAPDPVFEFNKLIIDATGDLCIAYKPNVAFYEAQGPKGWESLAKTLDYIPKNFFTIADAKRGDIGASSEKYAETFFKTFDFDALTVSPYMGRDSVAPFLSYPGKWAIVLALTSNQGAGDFQKPGNLFESVLKTSCQWGSADNMMYVAGATQAAAFKSIRAIVPDHFLLVPGVGAQGGNLQDLAAAGLNKDCGLIVNASRSILYASPGTDFAEKAKAEALRLQQIMKDLLTSRPV